MRSESLMGGFTDISIDAAKTFRAALDAMSRPGVTHRITAATPPAPMRPAAGALALTLCDPETPIWLASSLATSAVTEWFGFNTGAPLTERSRAMLAFGSWSELSPIDDFSIGVDEYPDRSATLIVEVSELGSAHRLTGPGIRTEAWLTAPDPAILQRNAALFPLGIDFFLTCGDQLAALPRTTRVEG